MTDYPNVIRLPLPAQDDVKALVEDRDFWRTKYFETMELAKDMSEQMVDVLEWIGR